MVKVISLINGAGLTKNNTYNAIDFVKGIGLTVIIEDNDGIEQSLSQGNYSIIE